VVVESQYVHPSTLCAECSEPLRLGLENREAAVSRRNGAAASHQVQQIEGQKPAARDSRSKDSSQPLGAADRRAAASR